MTGEPYANDDIAPEPPAFVELYHPGLDRTAQWNRDAIDTARASGWVTLDERDAQPEALPAPAQGKSQPATGATKEQ